MGTPGPSRFRPRTRHLTVSGSVRLAASRSREAEILQRFAFLLVALESIMPPAQRHAARKALLLDQARSLAAIHALARAERQAADIVAVRCRAASGHPAAARFPALRRRLRGSRRRRRCWLRLTPSPRPGG